jgi:hypothetical protein
VASPINAMYKFALGPNWYGTVNAFEEAGTEIKQ